MLQTIEVDKVILVKDKDELLAVPAVAYILGFEDENVAMLRAAMQEAHDTGQPVFPIVISNFGGSAYALFEMMDVLSQCRLPIATIVEGKAMSAAVALLTCGKEGMRYCGPHSTFMIHEVSSGTMGKNIDMQEDIKEYSRINEKVLKMMAKNVGQKEDYFTNLIHSKGHADWFLTAEQAKKHNLVNHIKLPVLKTKVTVITTLE